MKRLARTVWFMVAIGCACASMWADPSTTEQPPPTEGKQTDLTAMSVTDLLGIPVVTVVTAAKREQTTRRAPAQATVVTSDDIGRFGHRTLADVLRSVPGMWVSYDRSYGYLGVRGFGRPGDYGGRVLLLVDGHRMNDALYDTAALLNDFILDIDLIDRVEIVRGPGSALYGNNAFFAVVNVLTRRAGQARDWEASVEAGSWESVRGRLTYGTRTAGATDIVASASGYSGDGNPHLYFEDFDRPETADGVTDGNDGESLGSAFMSIGRGPWRLLAAWNGREKESPAPQYDAIFGGPISTSDGRGFLEARYETPLRGDEIKGQFRLYYDFYNYEADYLYDLADPGNAPEILVNHDEGRDEALGGEGQVDWHLSSRHLLTFGGEYRRDFRAELRNFDVSPPFVYLDLEQPVSSGGVYVQDEFSPTDRISVTAGLRFDHYDTFGDRISPRLAIVFDATDATTLKFLYGSAFRAPNVSEFYYEDDGLSTKLNPDLKAESVDTWELVLERKLGPRWHASLGGFQNDVEDLIDLLQDPEDGLFYYANLEGVKARGLDLVLQWQMSPELRGWASYTLTDLQDESSGERLSNSPRHVGKVNALVPLFRGLSLGGELQYLSERTTYDGSTLDDVVLVNTNLFAARLGGICDVSLGVYNLFDESYFDPAASPSKIEQDGRTVRLKATLRF